MTQTPLRIAFSHKTHLEQYRKAFPDARFALLDSVQKDFSQIDILVIDDADVLRYGKELEESSRPSIFVVCEADIVPESIVNGMADDLVVYPLRAADAHRLVRFHEQLRALRDLENESRGLPVLIKKLQEDL